VIDLDRIDEYCRKATEEPWKLHGEAFVFDSEGICVADCRWRDFDEESMANADFIAQARTDLPAVVAELREARELLERLCDGLSAGHGWGEAYEEACEFLEVTE
jgi:hypothetical protein